MIEACGVLRGDKPKVGCAANPRVLAGLSCALTSGLGGEGAAASLSSGPFLSSSRRGGGGGGGRGRGGFGRALGALAPGKSVGTLGRVGKLRNAAASSPSSAGGFLGGSGSGGRGPFGAVGKAGMAKPSSSNCLPNSSREGKACSNWPIRASASVGDSVPVVTVGGDGRSCGGWSGEGERELACLPSGVLSGARCGAVVVFMGDCGTGGGGTGGCAGGDVTTGDWGTGAGGTEEAEGAEAAGGCRDDVLDIADVGRCNGTEPLTGLPRFTLPDDEPPVASDDTPLAPDNDAFDPRRDNAVTDGGLGRLGRRWCCKSCDSRLDAGAGGTAGHAWDPVAAPPAAGGGGGAASGFGAPKSRLMRLGALTSMPCPRKALIRSAIEPPCS